MKSKIYSSEYMKTSSKGQMWIPAFAMIVFLLAFPVAELLSMGRWNGYHYTQRQLDYLYSGLWSSEFLVMGAVAVAATAFLAALSGFWYLYSPRKVDFYHSLPAKRSELFLHRVFLAVIYYLIPYAVMEFTAVCIGAARGYYSLPIMKKALMLLLVHLLIYLLVYFSTVLVIAVTGTILMGALAFMGLVLYSIVLAVLLQSYGQIFFETWYIWDYGVLSVLKNYGSPLTVISSFTDAYSSGTYGKQLMILIIAIILMAAASFAAFRKRRSENTGKALVYPWMERVLSVMVTVPSGLGIGLIFYLIPDNSSSTAWWIFGLVFGTVLVHGLVEVLCTMDFRKFFRRKLQLVIMGGVVAACALTMKLDLLGYDSYFPSYEEIRGMRVYAGNLTYTEHTCDVRKNENGTYRIQYDLDYSTGARLQDQPVLKSRKLYSSLKEIELQNETKSRKGRAIQVCYVNRFGINICRTYIASPEQSQNFMEALYEEKSWRDAKYSFLQIDDQYLQDITGTFCDGDPRTIFKKNREKQQALADALRKDIQDADGSTVKDQPCAMLMMDYAGIPSQGISGNAPAAKEGESTTVSVLVYPGFQRTLAILKETGYPLSISELPVEYINVYYMNSDDADDEGNHADDTEASEEGLSDLEYEEIENGRRVRYDKPDQLKALEECLRPAQLVNGWETWNADVIVELCLKGQKEAETEDELAGMNLTFTGEIPDFIKKDAEAAHVTEWEVSY